MDVQSAANSNPATNREALIVFAKAPLAGHVKTRLTTLLTLEEAAQLYRAFLKDMLGLYELLDVSIRVYVAPPANNFSRDLLPEPATLHEQEGQGLGQRMRNAFAETLTAGYQRAVITGTDHPTLPLTVLRSAFGVLRTKGSRPRVPIGPSRDGGYYLLGLSRLYPELFSMPYSHAGVFEETMGRVAGQGLLPVVLREWYDVDQPEDLNRLVQELRKRPNRARHTYRVLQRLTGKYNRLPAFRAVSTAER